MGGVWPQVAKFAICGEGARKPLPTYWLGRVKCRFLGKWGGSSQGCVKKMPLDAARKASIGVQISSGGVQRLTRDRLAISQVPGGGGMDAPHSLKTTLGAPNRWESGRLSTGTLADRIEGQLASRVTVYCEQVVAGAKLAGSVRVESCHVNYVCKLAQRLGCRTLVEKDENWAAVWIYKYPFVALLLKEYQARQAEERPSSLDVWLIGKLCGYSDYEIAKYLEEHEYMTSALE